MRDALHRLALRLAALLPHTAHSTCIHCYEDGCLDTWPVAYAAGQADGKVGALAEGYALGHLAATDHGRPL